MRSLLISAPFLISFIVAQAQDPLFVRGPIVSMPSLYDTVIDTADYDNDGHLDVLVAGTLGGFTNALKLFEVQNGSLVEITGTGLPTQANNVIWLNADGDSDLDVLAMVSTLTRSTAVIYINESGSFTATTYLNDLPARASLWPADYDNDGDDDLLVVGTDNSTFEPVTRLLKNEGASYTPVTTTINSPTVVPFVSWIDFDQDNDLDCFVTGANQVGSIIYQNNSGTFAALPIPLPAADGGKASWGDVDGDGDPDLLISGYATNFITAIYLNDGSTFSLYDQLTLTALPLGSCQFLDIDHDGDLDVFNSGTTDGINIQNELHLQTETGWELVENTGLPHVPNQLYFFVDYDSDKDPDALMLNDGYVGRIYRNTAIPGSLPPDNLPGWPGDLVAQGLTSSSIGLRFRDNSDNEFDYWLESRTGDDGSFQQLAIVSSFQQGSVSYVVSGLTPGTRYAFRGRGKNADGFSRYSDTAYAYTATEIFNKTAVDEEIAGLEAIELMDLDSDGDLDLIFGGGDATGNSQNRVQVGWNNNGSFLAEDLDLGDFDAFSFNGSDFDQDGDIDVLVSGIPSQLDPVTKLLINNGNGTFTTTNINVIGVKNGFINWVDVNGDGYDDIYVSGTVDNSSRVHVNQLLINDRQGSFHEKVNHGLPAIFDSGGVAWAYINEDSFIDIVVSGMRNPVIIFSENVSSVYFGNGDGTFRFSQELIPPGYLTAVGIFSSVTPADLDKDGDIDVVLTSWGGPTVIYWNEKGQFTPDTLNKFRVHFSGTSAVGDIDADGDHDLIISGYTFPLYTTFADVYLNDGTGNFTIANYPVYAGAGFFKPGDIDGDGDTDLIEGNGDASINVLINMSVPVNASPTPPVILSIDQSVNNIEVTFQASDDMTAAASLTTNFYLKDPEGHFLYNGISDRTTGYLMVPAAATRRLGNKIELKDLKQGAYEIGIQSIDAGLKASTFTVQSFEVVMMPPALASDTSACEQTSITVELEGNNIRWFKDEGLTVPAGTGNSLSIHVADTDTTLYAIQLYGTEKGPALPVTVKVYANPTGTIAKTSTGLRAPEGTEYKWYRNDVLVEAAAQRDLTTDIQGRYKVLVTNGPCAQAEFTSYIIHLPVLASDTVVCESNTITLEVTGTNIAWFKDEQLTQAAGTGNSFDVHVASSDTTLYAVQTIDAEKGPVLPVEIKVFRKPVGPISKTATGLMAPEGMSYKWYRNDTLLVAAIHREIVTPKVGSYKAIVSNGPCEETFIYVVRPLPPTLSIAASELCVGADQAVTAAGTKIMWYTRTGEHIGSEPGSETFTLQSVTLSDTVLLATQTVNLAESEKARAKWVVLDYPATVITFENGVYQAPAASTYQWFHDDELIEGATQRSLTPAEDGVFHVVASNGACSTESDKVTFVEVLDATTEMVVFYNHGTQSLYVNSGEYTLSTLRIYDMSGRHVQDEVALDRGREHSFSVAQLAQGIYIVHATTQSGPVYRMRFLK
jgi:hypothetical protein